MTAEELEQAFFRQLAEAYDAACSSIQRALRGSPGADAYFESEDALKLLRERVGDEPALAAVDAVMSEMLRSVTHSFCAILDGAAADSPSERVVASGLDGDRLREGLHQRWVDFLIETGRLDV